MARGWIGGWLTNMMAHGRPGEEPSVRASARGERRWLGAPVLVAIAAVAIGVALALAIYIFRFHRRA